MPDHPPKWTLFSPGGLSNRIKVLVSGRVLATHAGAELEMLWPLRATCNCPYERLFEPDPAVKTVAEEVTDALPRRIGWNVPPPDLLTHGGDIVLGHMSWLVRPDLYPRHDALWPELAPGLDALVPTESIRERVAAFTREHFRDFMIGVHLRRGDFHFARPDVSANTDAALRAIDEHLARNAGAHIFLATDDGAAAGPGAESVRNEGVRDRLARRYGDRVVSTTYAASIVTTPSPSRTRSSICCCCARRTSSSAPAPAASRSSPPSVATSRSTSPPGRAPSSRSVSASCAASACTPC